MGPTVQRRSIQSMPDVSIGWTDDRTRQNMLSTEHTKKVARSRPALCLAAIADDEETWSDATRYGRNLPPHMRPRPRGRRQSGNFSLRLRLSRMEKNRLTSRPWTGSSMPCRRNPEATRVSSLVGFSGIKAMSKSANKFLRICSQSPHAVIWYRTRQTARSSVAPMEVHYSGPSLPSGCSFSNASAWIRSASGRSCGQGRDRIVRR